MKRYLVFAYEMYYPSGGWDDFRGSVDSAIEFDEFRSKSTFFDYWQVVDSQTWTEVSSPWDGVRIL